MYIFCHLQIVHWWMVLSGLCILLSLSFIQHSKSLYPFYCFQGFAATLYNANTYFGFKRYIVKSTGVRVALSPQFYRTCSCIKFTACLYSLSNVNTIEVYSCLHLIPLPWLNDRKFNHTHIVLKAMIFLWQGFTHIIQVSEINHWRCFAGCCSRGKEKIVC